jgi:alanine racemase
VARAGDEVVLIGDSITLAEVCATRRERPSDLALAIGPQVERRWL